MTPFTVKSRPNGKFYQAKDADSYTKYFYTYSEVRKRRSDCRALAFHMHD